MGAGNSSAHRMPVRFGAYEVDFDSGELRKHGIKIRLQGQPLRVLQLLLDRPGLLVPRKELIHELWPEGTFVDYDHSLNAAVAKLRQALLDSAEKPQYIETMDRRGYRFVGKIEVSAPSESLSTRTRSRIWVSVSAVVIAFVAISSLYLHERFNTRPPTRVVPLTSYPGRQTMPAFSPDGKQVAFAWDGESGGNFDIYVKMLGVDSPLKLTNNPAPEYFPAWSPDGRRIAFSRQLADHVEILMVPALGGAERKLGEASRIGGLSWSPNARFLALEDKESLQGPYQLILLDIETGNKRRITSPPHHYFGDFRPRFSPDGKTIAFIRGSSAVTADLYVLAVNDDGTARGGPSRLTSRERVFDLDWATDSATIVFSSDHFGSTGLSTIPASGGVPKRLTIGSENAFEFSVSRTGNRLVYTRFLNDLNIWRVPGPNSPDRNSPPAKLIASTRYDSESQFSPDGKRIVFNSNRSGKFELWTCDAEGHDCEQLTFLDGAIPGSPRWSPDSRSVAFDSPNAGNSNIYVIDLGAGPPRLITSEPSADVRPSWSRDGRWIYFGSNRSGEWQIWKSPRQGGRAVQVTGAKGAREAFESLDGKFIYYAKLGAPGIWKIPAEGGDEMRVLQEGAISLWALTGDGICFFDLTHPAENDLKFYSYARRQTTVLRRFAKDTIIPTSDSSISVSTDGRWILYTQVDHAGSDLMLVENFR
jgi:Tol biopolymer transport system component/DNA-binding winged helix-turn-helix (wHTH) protein